MKLGKIALADIYMLARSKEFIRELSLPIVNNDEKERYVRKSSITTFLRNARDSLNCLDKKESG